MLTVKKPININTGKDIRTFPEKLNHTIPENYSILNEQMDAESLLFLMTNPREEGYIDNSSENTSIFNISGGTQKINLEVINNFINRITAYGSADFTYQDSVYVSSVLNKLGVSNVNEFMREVKSIKENTQSIKKLIGIYEKNVEKVRELPMSVREDGRNKLLSEGQGGPLEGVNINFLGDSIYNRLKTTEIYGFVHDFSRPAHFAGTEILNSEVLISEQAGVYEKLKLQTLKQEVGAWAHEELGENLNIYEKHENNNAFYNKDNILASAVAASLLSVAKSVFVNKEENDFSRTNMWTNLESAIYQSAENTMQRFSSYEPTEIQQKQTNNISIEEANEIYRQELSVANINQSNKQIDEADMYKQLQELNQKNIELYTNKTMQMVAKEENKRTNKGKKIDAQKVMKAALAALDNPDEAINNFFEEIHKTEKTVDLVQFYPPLEGMDAETRALNEAILKATLNPKKAEEEGLLLRVQNDVLITDLQRMNDAVEGSNGQYTEYTPVPLDGLPRNRMVSEEISESLTDVLAKVEAIINQKSGKAKEGSKKSQEEEIYENEELTYKETQILTEHIYKATEEEKERLKEIFQVSKPTEGKTQIEQSQAEGVHEEAKLVYNRTKDMVEETFEHIQETISENKRQEEISKREELIYKENQFTEEETQRTTDTEKKIFENLTEIVKPIGKAIKTQLPELKEFHESIPIIHKKVNDINEEALEEINKRISKTHREVVVETSQKTEVINKQEINNITQEITERTTEKLAATIDKTILNQIDLIAETVYGKLERKMGNERARRGY